MGPVCLHCRSQCAADRLQRFSDIHAVRRQQGQKETARAELGQCIGASSVCCWGLVAVEASQKEPTQVRGALLHACAPERAPVLELMLLFFAYRQPGGKKGHQPASKEGHVSTQFDGNQQSWIRKKTEITNHKVRPLAKPDHFSLPHGVIYRTCTLIFACTTSCMATTLFYICVTMPRRHPMVPSFGS